MSLPNFITALRIVVTPIFVIMLMDRKFEAAIILFGLAAISDGLDGLLARAMKQKTTLGAVLDPVADKLLLSSAYIVLGALQVLPRWLAVIVISRDVLIMLGVGILFIFRAPIKVRPSYISKITTFIQIVTIFYALSNEFLFSLQLLKPLLVWGTAAITILSGLHYLYIGMTFSSEGDR
jgi:cardiolipin synthase (CMP-forming)